MTTFNLRDEIKSATAASSRSVSTKSGFSIALDSNDIEILDLVIPTIGRNIYISTGVAYNDGGRAWHIYFPTLVRELEIESTDPAYCFEDFLKDLICVLLRTIAPGRTDVDTVWHSESN